MDDGILEGEHSLYAAVVERILKSNVRTMATNMPGIARDEASAR
jgi:hypothetical protein